MSTWPQPKHWNGKRRGAERKNGRMIDSLHREAMIWMDRFAFTLNGSQELPRLLSKAKAMANVYSIPEEDHGLLNYCQHMINLMAH